MRMVTIGGEYRAGFKNGSNPEVVYRVLIDDPVTKLRQAVENGASAEVIGYWVGARDGFESRPRRSASVLPYGGKAGKELCSYKESMK
jgi:hypothetical protein